MPRQASNKPEVDLENEWMLLNKNCIALSGYKDVDKNLNWVCKFSKYPG